ncbi:hypothetical protein H4R33_004375 [Dimargaris cristalligena]|nr:hypothetical protein H4R33_004375 [Dimargaris cristalligena]
MANRTHRLSTDLEIVKRNELGCLIYPSVVDNIFTACAEHLSPSTAPGSGGGEGWPIHITRLFGPLQRLNPRRINRTFEPFAGHFHYLVDSLQGTVALLLLLLPEMIHVMTSMVLFGSSARLSVAARRTIDMKFPQLLHGLLALAILWKEIFSLCAVVVPSELHRLVPKVNQQLVHLHRQGFATLNQVGHEFTLLWCRWRYLNDPRQMVSMERMTENQALDLFIPFETNPLLKDGTPLAASSPQLPISRDQSHPSVSFAPNHPHYRPPPRTALFPAKPALEQSSGTASLRELIRTASVHRGPKNMGSHKLTRKRHISLPFLGQHFHTQSGGPPVVTAAAATAAGVAGVTQGSALGITSLDYQHPNASTETNLFSSTQVQLRQRKTATGGKVELGETAKAGIASILIPTSPGSEPKRKASVGHLKAESKKVSDPSGGGNGGSTTATVKPWVRFKSYLLKWTRRNPDPVTPPSTPLPAQRTGIDEDREENRITDEVYPTTATTTISTSTSSPCPSGSPTIPVLSNSPLLAPLPVPPPIGSLTTASETEWAIVNRPAESSMANLLAPYHSAFEYQARLFNVGGKSP